jgi:hypothetical protein
MPKFFFHVWDTKAFVADPDGSELPDAAAATKEALANAWGIMQDGQRRGEDRQNWLVEVRDESDQTVVTIPLSQAEPLGHS